MPLPPAVAWRTRQAVGGEWLAISARLSVVRVAEGSESRVAMTENPLVERAARRRAAKERVRDFSGRLSVRRAPESEPPWAGSRKMTVRGIGCWAEREAARLVSRASRRRAAMGLAGGVKG